MYTEKQHRSSGLQSWVLPSVWWISEMLWIDFNVSSFKKKALACNLTFLHWGLSVPQNEIQIARKGSLPSEMYLGTFSCSYGTGTFKWALSYGMQLDKGLSSKVRNICFFFIFFSLSPGLDFWCCGHPSLNVGFVCIRVKDITSLNWRKMNWYAWLDSNET